MQIGRYRTWRRTCRCSYVGTMRSTLPSLQNLCLLQLVRRLEDYPPELLALLPTRLRHRLLLHLPVVDVCQLEQTCFIEGLNVETVWCNLLKKHYPRYGMRPLVHSTHPRKCYLHPTKDLLEPLQGNVCNSRELYLSLIAAIILNNARPSGYFDINQLPIIADHCGSSQGIYQPDDIVNYLVCGCCDELMGQSADEDDFLITEKESTSTEDEDPCKPAPITCYGVALLGEEKRTPPPAYIKAFNDWHLIPPRYKHYFPNINLSNQDAIQVLSECCHFHPKVLDVNGPAFASIAWHHTGRLTQHKSILLLLSTFFCNIESASILGSDQKFQASLAILSAILKTGKPVLSSLCVAINSKTLGSLALLLTEKQQISTICFPSLCCEQIYCGVLCMPFVALKKLELKFPDQPHPSIKLQSTSDTVDNCTINMLATILKQQSSLETLHIENLHLDSECPALESYCQQPHFRNLILCNVELPQITIQRILKSFIQSPSCSFQQSLILDSIKISNHSTCNLTQSHLSGSHKSFCDLDRCCQSSNAAPLYALEHKSLALRHIPTLITEWLMQLNEVRLTQTAASIMSCK